ncbi:Topoisomerase DNA binding C4 zinc finger [Nitrosomonas cryotolerans]|nr:Topoisomerase DNA binding C4 zinc finger [Nitrosomonas cryotolerans]
MPGLVKIGLTFNSPYLRAEQLSSTGVPDKFVVEEYWECSSEELRKIEKEIHKQLGSKRYSNNREFFELSVDDARESVSNYFKRKSDLEFKKIKEEKEKKERGEKVRKWKQTLHGIEVTLVKEVDALIGEINSNEDLIAACLESILSADEVIKFLSKTENKDIPGKIISHTGWKINASYSYHGGDQRPKQLQADNAKIYISIGVMTKRFFHDVDTYDYYFSFTYSLHTDEINLGLSSKGIRPGDTLLYKLIEKGLFPATLSELLKSTGITHLVGHWESIFGTDAGIRKQIQEGLECPLCNKGTIVLKQGRRSGKPFYGCSNWPGCNFLFNLLLPREKIIPVFEQIIASNQNKNWVINSFGVHPFIIIMALKAIGMAIYLL